MPKSLDKFVWFATDGVWLADADGEPWRWCASIRDLLTVLALEFDLSVIRFRVLDRTFSEFVEEA
jgi:hypothetical protein